MSMSKSGTPEIPRGDTKRRSFYLALEYSAEAPMGWEGEGERGFQPPLPKKALFVLLSLIFFKIANEIRAFLDNKVEGSGAEKSLIQFILAMRSFI